jgi:hypothetical protein
MAGPPTGPSTNKNGAVLLIGHVDFRYRLDRDEPEIGDGKLGRSTKDDRAWLRRPGGPGQMR